MADEAWEKVRATGSVQQDLQSECGQLRDQMSQCQHERSLLLTACALLTSALYPMYARTNELICQRRQLQEQVKSHQHLKHQIKVVIIGFLFIVFTSKILKYFLTSLF